MANYSFPYELVWEEVSNLLEREIPQSDQRQEAVERLFQFDEGAPAALVLEKLLARPVPGDQAPAIWRLAVEIQHRWSMRLEETVSLQAAAMEAVVRSRAAEPPAAEAPSLRSYLDRDMLTGLFVPQRFESSLTSEIGLAASTGQPISLVILDLDGANNLNRTLGREKVDEIFRELGEAIRHGFRAEDIPCRLEGDEFALILPATTRQRAQSLTEELAAALHKLDAPVTFSAGIAAWPEDGKTARELQRAALSALRWAQSQGGGAIATHLRDRRSPDSGGIVRRRTMLIPVIAAVGLAAIVGGVGYVEQHPRSRHVATHGRAGGSPHSARPGAHRGAAGQPAHTLAPASAASTSVPTAVPAPGEHPAGGRVVAAIPHPAGAAPSVFAAPRSTPVRTSGARPPAPGAAPGLHAAALRVPSSSTPSDGLKSAGARPAAAVHPNRHFPQAPFIAPATIQPFPRIAPLTPSPTSASSSPGIAPRSLLEAAQPRTTGDYALAAYRLKQLALSTSDPALRVRANLAAACAEAAAGVPPWNILNRGWSGIRQAPAADQPSLTARFYLIRGQYYGRRGQSAAARADLTRALTYSSSGETGSEAAAELIEQEQVEGMSWNAWQLASQLAQRQTNPALRSAYQILAADAIGYNQGVLQAFRAHPGAVSAPGGLGEAVEMALADAVIPESHPNTSPWAQESNLVLHTVPPSRTGSLRLILAERLLDLNDPGDAESILAPALSGQEPLSKENMENARFVDGIALSSTGSRDAARKDFEQVAAAGSLPADVWAVGPDEQWWAGSARLLLNQESVSEFRSLLAREGLPRATDGQFFLTFAHAAGNAHA